MAIETKVLMRLKRKHFVRQDLFHYYNSYAKLIALHTFGYFIFDCIDYTRRSAWAREMDIFWHHLIIITGAIFTLFQDQYYGYIVTGLMVEWNSVILHIRRTYCAVESDRCENEIVDTRLIYVVEIGVILVLSSHS